MIKSFWLDWRLKRAKKKQARGIPVSLYESCLLTWDAAWKAEAEWEYLCQQFNSDVAKFKCSNASET